MGNTGVPQSPRDYAFGFAQQLALGTAIAGTVDLDGATPEYGYEIDCDPFDVTLDVKEYVNVGSHATRSLKDGDFVYHSRRAMPTFTVSGTCNHNTLDHLLYSWFQNVTEGGAAVYSKTYTVHATQPDFIAYNATTDVGHLSTWFVRDPTSGAYSTQIKDCICKSLTITAETGQPIKFSAEMVGNGVPITTHTVSGTWTRAVTTDLWYMEDLDIATLDFGGGAVNMILQGFEFNFSREIVAVGQGDGTGGFSVHGLSGREMTAKIKVMKDTDWTTAVTNYKGDTAIVGRIGIGNATPGTDDGDLDFAFRGKANAVPVDFGDVMYGDLEMKLLMNDAGSVEPMTVVMAASNLRTWGTT